MVSGCKKSQCRVYILGFMNLIQKHMAQKQKLRYQEKFHVSMHVRKAKGTTDTHMHPHPSFNLVCVCVYVFVCSLYVDREK